MACLITHSTIFGPEVSCSNIYELTQNEDVMFIASLLLKMTEIAGINSKIVRNICFAIAYIMKFDFMQYFSV